VLTLGSLWLHLGDGLTFGSWCCYFGHVVDTLGHADLSWAMYIVQCTLYIFHCSSHLSMGFQR